MSWYEVIDAQNVQGPLDQVVGEALTDHTLVVIKGAGLDENSYERLAATLGSPIIHNANPDNEMFGSGAITHLRGDPEQTMSLSRDILPLHNDGVVFDRRIDYLMLYCVKAEGMGASGSTIVVDQQAAFRDLDRSLLGTLGEISIEYLLVHESFHDLVEDEEKWVETTPLTHDGDGRPMLLIEFPYPADVAPGWKVRIKGWNEADSDEFLSLLERHFAQERYRYTHRWSQGDLLVLHNRRTLHGRAQMNEAGERYLMRCHIKALS